MKNELHPWEVGIAEQVKGKEFSFDPQAFSDFEELLAAETLGREPGVRAPDAAGEIMSAGSSTLSLPIVLLIIGLAGLAGWWFLTGEAETAAEPGVTISAPAPAPSTEIAPAAPPTSLVPISTTPVRTEVRERPATSPNPEASPANVADLTKTEDEGLGEVIGAAIPNSPRALRATSRLASLPIEPVAPLSATAIPLPPVRKPRPINLKRDRKALFPDVIKKN